jgi:hypothetical protein
MALTYSYISATDSYSVISNSCTAGAVVIPSTYNDGTNGTKAVKTLGSSAFLNCTTLTSITIPSSVTTIGDFAIYGCIGLTNITIPNSVTSIGASAFHSCTNLTSISIGSGVTNIGNYAFNYCPNLTSFSVDFDNLDFMSEDGVLFNKTKTILRGWPNAKANSYSIPQNVVNIGIAALSNCVNLTSVTIPDRVIYIGINAFRGCSGLTNITIPRSVTTIDSYGIADCSSLIRINFLGNPPALAFSSLQNTSATKVYRKKNFVTGWSSTFGGLQVLLWSDNVVKSGGSGKLTTKKRN